jgi:SAM-dependent methyltransferase
MNQQTGFPPQGLADLYDSADLYDAQYDAYRDDIPWYLRLAADTGGPVLELGSGTGRLSAALAGAGHTVTGVELSEAMLQRARERLAGPLSANVTLLQGDMRQLGKLPLEPASHPLVLAPFNVLMHLPTLDEQDATLAAVRSLLAPGGVFALDLFMPRFGPLGVLRQVSEWAQVGGDASQLFMLQEVDEDAQLVTSRYYLDTVRSDGSLQRRSVQLKQRYYHRFEIERALRHAGFTRVSVAGGFDQGRWHSAASHMIITARP